MDLFQLLVSLPFVDQRKLTSKVLNDWSWSLDSIAKGQDEQQPAVGPDGQPLPVGPDGQPIQGAPGVAPGGAPQAPGGSPMDPNAMASMMGGAPQGGPQAPTGSPAPQLNNINQNVLTHALSMLRKPGEQAGQSAFQQASAPINLTKSGSNPPTVRGSVDKGAGGAKTTNTRGHNRKLGGKVNTNIPNGDTTSIESRLLNRSQNIQN
jgi:hypothetical protein